MTTQTPEIPTSSGFFEWMILVHYYCIVPSKCPWVLEAQAPKIGVGGYTKEVLEWFNCPHASAHPGSKVSCQGVLNWPTLLLCLSSVEASPTVEKTVSC